MLTQNTGFEQVIPELKLINKDSVNLFNTKLDNNRFSGFRNHKKMRIWSLHPKYLDGKGLVALWRETLLAKKVLEGKTKGYRHHPQLERFRQAENPSGMISRYLQSVYQEAVERGYHFDSSKFDSGDGDYRLSVTSGQMEYEYHHLLNKLKIRDPERHRQFIKLTHIEPHPLFVVVEGKVEKWEISEPDRPA